LIPALIVYQYNKIHNWFTEKKSNKWYYARAIVICAVFFDVIVVCLDRSIIINGFDDNTAFGDVIFYYIIGLIFVTLLPFLDFALAFGFVWYRVPGMTLFTAFIQCILITAVVLALQELFHHCYYFLLAIIASSFHSLSLLILYATTIFCAVMWAIVIIKLYFIKILGVFFCISLFVLFQIVIFFVVFVIVMLMVLVSEHQNSGFTEFFSSVLLSVLSFGAKMVLNCLRMEK